MEQLLVQEKKQTTQKRKPRRSNGEGSIYKNKSLNKWVGQYTAYGKRKAVYGNTKSEVVEKLHKELVNIKENKYIDKSQLTIKNVLDLMLEEEERAKRLSTSTLLRKKRTGEIIKQMYIADLPIQKVGATQISDCLLDLAHYSNSYISKIYQLLAATYNKAMLLQIINVNPFTIKGNIIKPTSDKEDKKVEALTIEEHIKFLNQLQAKDYLYKDVFYTLIETGMRVGEALVLKKENVDFKNNIIHVKKSLTRNGNDQYIEGKRTKTYAGIREVPLSSFLKGILKDKPTIDGYYFKQANGKFLTPTIINAHCKRIAKDCHIKETIHKVHRIDKDTGKKKVINLKYSSINTHCLRHTFATRMIESGVSAVVVQRILGHRDIQTTLNTYTSVFNKFKEDEIGKLDQYLTSKNIHTTTSEELNTHNNYKDPVIVSFKKNLRKELHNGNQKKQANIIYMPQV